MSAGAGGSLPIEFIRFVLVGACGFAIDAGVLTLLTTIFGFNVYASRAVSFGIAVLVTWLINRFWTFSKGAVGSKRNASVEYARYLMVQGVGALTNLGIFAAVLAIQPQLIKYPVIPLAIGSVVGLIVNFTGARRWVFVPRIGHDAV